jgi:hypothetical protein
MIETIAQIFGTIFVGVILVCIVGEIGNIIFEDIKLKKNKK